MSKPNKPLTAYMAALTPKQKTAMAAALGVTEKYLAHLCYGFRKASVVDSTTRKALVPRICRYTRGKLTPHMLRPDVYTKDATSPTEHRRATPPARRSRPEL